MTEEYLKAQAKRICEWNAPNVESVEIVLRQVARDAQKEQAVACIKLAQGRSGLSFQGTFGWGNDGACKQIEEDIRAAWRSAHNEELP